MPLILVATPLQTKAAGSIMPDAPAAPPKPTSPKPESKPASPTDVPAEGAETEEATQTTRWAGDLVENEDEITDPANAVARFEGDGGEQAWLDKGTDGTLVGWVRDGEDTYRYTDPDAWATDVDDAGMSRVDKKAAKDETSAEEAEPSPESPPRDGRERSPVGAGRTAPEPLDMFAPARGFPTQQRKTAVP